MLLLFILQVRVRFREAKRLAQGLTATVWRSQRASPVCLALKAKTINTVFYYRAPDNLPEQCPRKPARALSSLGRHSSPSSSSLVTNEDTEPKSIMHALLHLASLGVSHCKSLDWKRWAPIWRTKCWAKMHLLSKHSFNTQQIGCYRSNWGTKHGLQTGLVWPTLYCAVLEITHSCHLTEFSVSGSLSMPTGSVLVLSSSCLT